MAAKTDSTPVVCEVKVEATPETIFGLLTDPQKIVRWMGKTARLGPVAGGEYAIDIGDQIKARGEFVEVVPNRKVVFTFGWEGSPIAPGSTTVTIELEPHGSTTLVRLTHAGLPAEAAAEHADGWNHYLARLAIAGAGRDPGPDKNQG